jgi:peptidyl-prolyl cis-trans isomerase A (cyclophilin A)
MAFAFFRGALPLAAALASANPSNARVLLQTDRGSIEILVDAAHAPKTTANFLRYVDYGRYNGGRFHRTVRLDNVHGMDVVRAIQGAPADGQHLAPPVTILSARVSGAPVPR